MFTHSLNRIGREDYESCHREIWLVREIRRDDRRQEAQPISDRRIGEEIPEEGRDARRGSGSPVRGHPVTCLYDAFPGTAYAPGPD